MIRWVSPHNAITEFPHLDPPGDYTPPFLFSPEEDAQLRIRAAWMSYQVSTRKRAAGGYPAGSKVVRRTPAATRTYIKRTVQQCIRRDAEHKHVTTTDAFTPAAAGTLGTILNDLTQGTSNGTRVGSQVRVHSIEAIIQLNLPAAGTGDMIRCILVQDHQPNNAAPFITNILETSNMNSPYNLDQVGTSLMGQNRFRILYDRLVTLNATSAIVATGTAFVQTCFRKKVMVNAISHYQGNAGTVNDLVKNSYVWLFISAGGTVIVNARTQVCYSDI